VSLQLIWFSSTEHDITIHIWIYDLSNNFWYSFSYYKSVSLWIIFIFLLEYESSSGIVVSLSFSSSLWFGLHTRIVSFVL
jgi:hypothetical protein